jgi:hypothetical protein
MLVSGEETAKRQLVEQVPTVRCGWPSCLEGKMSEVSY